MNHRDSHHHIIDKLAVVVAVLSAVALYPQLYSLLKYGDGKETLSAVSFGLIFVNNIVWTWYGYHRKMLPITLSSIITCIASGWILLLII
ncbi:MAG: hypothetical protein JWL80_571 [Parcubacteria group bacterium]|nr:hypothetical protein [Parcubacteria group bacterium]